MTPERFQQIEHLYHSVLEREENQRAAFLEEACAGDEALGLEVESLLAQEKRAERFEESPALQAAKSRPAKLDPWKGGRWVPTKSFPCSAGVEWARCIE